MRRLILGTVVTCIACSGGGTSAPRLVRIAPIQSELKGDDQITHVLSRLSYGPRPGDMDSVRRLGVERWIALQLTPDRIKDPRGDSAVATYEALGSPTNELTAAFREVRVARRDTARRADPALMRNRRSLQMAVNEVASAKLARAVVSERQLYEQMVDFWENHFSVFVGKGQTRLFIPAYDRDVIRPLALGRFRDLLGTVARSPAMLFYLDNAQSGADSMHQTLTELTRLSSRRPRISRPGRPRPGLPPRPVADSARIRVIRPGVPATPAAARRRPGLNENYARELMELHTLGVDGGYTQQDVVEVARALTGWSIDPAEGAFIFRPNIHDADEKMVLGTRLVGGRGIEDGEQVLDILARHPSTARFITKKLVVRFVSDSAPPELVSRCADVFTKTDGDIRQVLRCVVTSPEFFSKSAYRAKVKTPFEVVASALRAANAVPDGSPRATQIVAQLGQPIFGRQTPDGWPDRAEEWVNAGAMVNRVNFGLSLAQGRAPGVRHTPGSLDKAVATLLSSPEFQRR